MTVMWGGKWYASVCGLRVHRERYKYAHTHDHGLVSGLDRVVLSIHGYVCFFLATQYIDFGKEPADGLFLACISVFTRTSAHLPHATALSVWI